MEEQIFTQKDIAEIEKYVADNPDMIGVHIMDGNATATTVIKISEVSGLVFTEGNKDTGYEHIRLRHSFFSEISFWKNNGESVKPDNPSRFKPEIIPMIDYIKIADSLYKTENLDVIKNNRPEIFDKYVGMYKHQDDSELKYHLLVYKNSKVVHALYPNKGKHYPKKVLKYARGIISSSFRFSPSNSIEEMVIPYENENSITVYSILFIRKFEEGKEYLRIQVHNSSGKPYMYVALGEKPLEDIEPYDRKTMYDLQYADLSEYEEIINRIDGEIEREE